MEWDINLSHSIFLFISHVKNFTNFLMSIFKESRKEAGKEIL